MPILACPVLAIRFLTTLVQLWGEEKAFDYLKKLNANVAQYSKSGLATGNLSTGEVSVDVSFMHSYVREKDKGAPVKGILPCERCRLYIGRSQVSSKAHAILKMRNFSWIGPYRKKRKN